MSKIELPRLLQAAMECQRNQDLEGAKALCHQALAIHPDHPDILHMLGIIAYGEDQLETAENLIQRAQTLYPHRHPAIERNLAMVKENREIQEKLQSFCAEALAAMADRIIPYRPILAGSDSPPVIDIAANLSTVPSADKVRNLVNELIDHGLPPPNVWHIGANPASGDWAAAPQPSWESGRLPSGQAILFMGLSLDRMEWLEYTHHDTTLLYCDELDHCRLQNAIELASMYGKRQLSLIYETEVLFHQTRLPGEIPSSNTDHQPRSRVQELADLLTLP